MLAQVASMFRLALSNTNSLVAVQEEVAHIEHYLKFQQVRWEDKMTYIIKVDEDCKQCLMPKIFLQPFVENAFMHGFHGAVSAELRIEIHRDEDNIVVTIADNGKGLSDNWQNKPRKRGGYGLRNVQERLDALFGNQYRLQLSNRVQGGVQVDIRFPLSDK
ncbi:putative sensor-like histidine kinase [compost metagenome]